MLGWKGYVKQGAKTCKSAEMHFKASLKHYIIKLGHQTLLKTISIFTVTLVLCQAKFNCGLSPPYGSVNYFCFDFKSKILKMEKHKVNISSNAIHISFVNKNYKGEDEHFYKFTM